MTEKMQARRVQNPKNGLCAVLPKMYVHDAMGRSLLTIQDLMNNSGQTEKKIAALQSAVSVLSDIRPSIADTLAEAVSSAERLGVRVELIGGIPEGISAESLLTAAVRECVTNCLRHAGGDTVFVEISREKSNLAVTITNNGTPPNGEITEGSGLSSLRHSVEAGGGEMSVLSSPRFQLRPILKGKEQP